MPDRTSSFGKLIAICFHFQFGAAASIVRFVQFVNCESNPVSPDRMFRTDAYDYVPFILVTDLRETVNQFEA